MNHRKLAVVGLAAAGLQVAYGLIAVARPYPAIVEDRFEVLWALVNLGLAATVVAWFASGVAAPRRVALGAAAVAVAGHLLRIGGSALAVSGAGPSPETLIVPSIVLMFAGLATLGVCTVRARRLTGWPAWVPLVVTAVGFLVAGLYSVDRGVHFVLLGLVWGPAWLLMAYVAYRQPLPADVPDARRDLVTP